MERKCDRCGRDIHPSAKRDRVGTLFVCEGCLSLSNHWKDHENVGFAKNAHDMSDDPMVIRHCAFCGSGQVIARSDGSTECEFCQSVFTIKMEPFFPSWPQTVDGVPQDVPLSPNMEDEEVGDMEDPPGELPPEDDEMVDPDALDEDGEDDFAEEEEELPPFNSSFRTAMGDVIDEDAYIRHLAIQFAPDRDQMINKIRGRRH